jgi:DNA sulfur modification protein DndE
MTANRIIKIFLSAEATQKVRTLKGRTGLAPNVLCRLALTLSLREPGIPDPAAFPSDGMEFNRYTLLGSHDVLVLALLRERCLQDGLDPDQDLPEQLRAHINRGVSILYPRLKSVSDLGDLVARSWQGRSESHDIEKASLHGLSCDNAG